MYLNHRKFGPTREVISLVSILQKDDAQGTLVVFLTLTLPYKNLIAIEVHANLLPPENVTAVAPLAGNNYLFGYPHHRVKNLRSSNHIVVVEARVVRNSLQTITQLLVSRCSTLRNVRTRIAHRIMGFPGVTTNAIAHLCRRSRIALASGNKEDADSTTDKITTTTGERTNSVEADVNYYNNHTTIIYHYSHHPNYHSTN
jgi:hypothetical protein